MSDDTKATIVSFPQAMMHFFGKNGKDNLAFMAELKALSDGEKAEFREMLKDVGYSKL